MRCRACRRPLTSPVSIKYGYGPDCLRRAQAAGNVPLEALAELIAEKRTTRKRRPSQAPATIQQTTGDLFDQLIDAAIDDLRRAADVARSLGVVVNLEIECNRL